MAPETVTVTITSSMGDDAPLTVHDAMHQILDFFGLLSEAGGDESGSISWQLVSVSMKSPLSATAQAFPTFDGAPVTRVARAEKEKLLHGLQGLTTGEHIPEWMSPKTRSVARRFFDRVTNGIGRVDVQVDDVSPLTIIVSKGARTAVSVLDHYERESIETEEDLSRTEYGSIEGDIEAATTYRGNPAIKLQERLSGASVNCIFRPDLADKVGRDHSWSEVWSGRRVLVVGEIAYKADGTVQRVEAWDVRVVAPEQSDYFDPNFTSGKNVSEYLASLWDEKIG